MPEPDGCHSPELGGAKCPKPGYQPPVDKFAQSTAFLPGAARRGLPIWPSSRGTKCPNGSGGALDRPPEGSGLGQGVPNARMTAPPASV